MRDLNAGYIGFGVFSKMMQSLLFRRPHPSQLRKPSMKRLLIALFAAALLLANTGCSTMADAKAAKGTGTAKVYDKPYDVVWDAVITSVKTSGLSLVSADKAQGSILAKGAISGFSWGENVAVYVDDAGGKVKTRVEVINKRTVGPNITAANWETRLFADIDKKIAPGAK